LEGLAFGTQGEPEIEGGGNGGLNLVFCEDPAGVGDRAALQPGGTGWIGSRAMGGVGLAGVVTREVEDLGLKVRKPGHAGGG
jgi:hypothetical protein